METLISFALSVLANNIPTIKDILTNDKSFNNWIIACYDKALDKLGWNDAANDKYKGKAISSLDELKNEIQGNVNGLDNDKQLLVAEWVNVMQNDPKYSSYFNTIQNNIIIETTNSNKEILDKISKHIDIESINSKIEGIDTKQNDIKSNSEEIKIKIEEGGNKILQKIDESNRYWDNKDSLIHINYNEPWNNNPDISIVVEQIVKNKLWSDTNLENKIIEDLPLKGMLVVKGHEGRGKTTLCLKAAYSLFTKKGYEVFITQKSWSWDTIKKPISEIINNNCRTVIILEDVHKLSTDSNQVVEFILKYCYANKSNTLNTLFLLNHRPSLEDEVELMINTLTNYYVLDLSQVQQERAKNIKEYLTKQNALPENNLKVDGELLDNNIPPNLKVLSIYFDVYRTQKHEYNVTENNILYLYNDSYELKNLDTNSPKMRALCLLGALGYFDAPVDSVFLDEQENEELVKLTNNGLCSLSDNKFFISHSTDAQFLCSLLVSKNHRKYKSREKLIDCFIKEYYERIKNYQNMYEELRLDVEKDFGIPILSQLYQEKGFENLDIFFIQLDNANFIVTHIIPSYILRALYYKYEEEYAKIQERFEILYRGNVGYFKDHITSLPAIVLRKLQLCLKNHYEYRDLLKDLFGDQDANILKIYVEKRGEELNNNFSVLRKNIAELGDKHKLIIDITIKKNRKGDPESYRIIQNTSIKKYQRKLEKISSSITSTEDSQHKEPKVNEIMESVKKSLSINNGELAPGKLSRILHYLGSINYEVYSNFINDSTILNAIQYNIANRRINNNYLYLYSHFYNTNTNLKEDIIRLITSASNSDSEREIMKEWVELVKKKYPILQEDSLAFDINQLISNNDS